MDSSASPIHGEQEGAAYDGHFGCTCYRLDASIYLENFASL